MPQIPLSIVGCGGMGHRHLFALAELQRAGLSPFELVAACDPVTDNANSLADEAASLLGKRPAVVANYDELSALGVAAVDITTTPRFHHTLAVDALARGWHAMVEKPVGLTVRACNQIRAAAQDSGLVVSVAENYRRDPVNRLAKALLDAGAIGAPRFMIHQTGGGADRMTISVWRHQKDQSGVLLDVGVHYADMMEYFLGEITSVYAQMRLHEPIRYNPAGEGKEPTSNPAGVYGKWQRQMPARFEATADDAIYGTLNFASGAVCQYIEDHAMHGQGMWTRQIHGSKGSFDLPNDRSGVPIRMTAGGETVDDGRLLDLVPDFRLDEATATLFGGDRLWRYDFPFNETDRKLIAVEYADFGDAIAGKHPAEVDIEQGSRSVAVSYALMESGQSGQIVNVADVLAEKIGDYQASINTSLGI
ncbi:MAG: Gfo/Idh/MocA family oxidoreductase [Caldilineaceae bacterium]